MASDIVKCRNWMRCGYGQSLKPNASAPSFLAWYHSVTAIRASDVHCLFRESLPARPPHSGFARFSHKSCVLLLAQRGEYADCGYFRFAPIVRDTAAAGWLRPSLAEGRGLSLITVCGYRRETRVLFLLRAFWWWVKNFFSVGLGGAPSSAKAMEDGAAPRWICPSLFLA